VDSISRTLHEPRVLRGAEVDTARLKSAMASAELFHFAGHAVFDDARPQYSQLVVGARGLTAATIAQMSLKRLRLVVLSACETNRASSGAGAGFLGLSESLMAAGVGGVIGSLWKVEDSATRALMQSFYAALAKSGDPVQALREAQRASISLSPAAWAAFRYTGS
jgi:CHAT domain-containing protein